MSYVPPTFHCVRYIDGSVKSQMLMLSGIFSKMDDAEECKASLEAGRTPAFIVRMTLAGIKQHIIKECELFAPTLEDENGASDAPRSMPQAAVPQR